MNQMKDGNESVKNQENEAMEVPEKGFEGTLVDFTLVDLIQMCCLAGKTVSIIVSSGEEEGEIVIRDGDIIHAATRDLTGEEAFYGILMWPHGRFNTREAQTPYEVSITQNYQYLLMEAVRLEDEKAGTPDEDEGAEEAPGDGEAPGEVTSDLSGNSEVSSTVRVLIVDDSKTMCRILRSILSEDPMFEVAATADNGKVALQLVDELKPDLITMDVNMPVMDGGTALKHIMLKSSCPVVIISSLNQTAQSGDAADSNAGAGKAVLDFLRLGAVDFIQKPSMKAGGEDQKILMCERLKRAARAKTSNFVRTRMAALSEQPEKQTPETARPCRTLVVIQSGMGGVGELMGLMAGMPIRQGVAVAAFQDMPVQFVEPMASYLDSVIAFTVEPAGHDTVLYQDFSVIGSMADVGRYSLSVPDSHLHLAAGENTEEQMGFERFATSAVDRFTGPVLLILLSGARIDDRQLLKTIHEKNGRVIIQKGITCMFPPEYSDGERIEPVEDQIMEADTAELQTILSNI